jgi:peptide deformylase
MSSVIRTFPDPCLRVLCKPVQSFDQALERLIHSMRLTMRNQKMGVGIAAPQVGILLQIALVDVSARVPGAGEIVLINPEIDKLSGETLSHEGCMSLPEYTGYVQRAAEVSYRYYDQNGKLCYRKSEGIEAVCIQHEMDHLQGKLFFDRVVTLKTDMQPRHWKKKKRP